MTNFNNAIDGKLALFEDVHGNIVHGIISHSQFQSTATDKVSVHAFPAERKEVEAKSSTRIKSTKVYEREDAEVIALIDSLHEFVDIERLAGKVFVKVESRADLSLVEVKGALLIEPDGIFDWSRDNLIPAAQFHAPGERLPAVSVEQEENSAEYPFWVALPDPRT